MYMPPTSGGLAVCAAHAGYRSGARCAPRVEARALRWRRDRAAEASLNSQAPNPSSGERERDRCKHFTAFLGSRKIRARANFSKFAKTLVGGGCGSARGWLRLARCLERAAAVREGRCNAGGGCRLAARVRRVHRSTLPPQQPRRVRLRGINRRRRAGAAQSAAAGGGKDKLFGGRPLSRVLTRRPRNNPQTRRCRRRCAAPQRRAARAACAP